MNDWWKRKRKKRKRRTTKLKYKLRQNQWFYNSNKIVNWKLIATARLGESNKTKYITWPWIDMKI